MSNGSCHGHLFAGTVNPRSHQLSVKAVVAHFAQVGGDTMNFNQLPTLVAG